MREGFVEEKDMEKGGGKKWGNGEIGENEMEGRENEKMEAEMEGD